MTAKEAARRTVEYIRKRMKEFYKISKNEQEAWDRLHLKAWGPILEAFIDILVAENQNLRDRDLLGPCNCDRCREARAAKEGGE